jgi:signal transduction histidine kinase
VSQTGSDVLAGVMVLGVNPRHALDDNYRIFFKLFAGNVASAMANAAAREEERKRNEAMAELDRAKTIFFSNISHEFRTPLTLMLGPLEDLMALPSPQNKEELHLIHRNALRLLKLVNSLLDFSRLEAGKTKAVFEATDLGQLTQELSSIFRSAIESAGMKLIIDCPALSQDAYVDRDMWEKVVLNLLSNALKFTLHGQIEVHLSQISGTHDAHSHARTHTRAHSAGSPAHTRAHARSWPRAEAEAELRVVDTGIGIPESELQHIGKRFHRITTEGGRSHEGTGIGTHALLARSNTPRAFGVHAHWLTDDTALSCE